MFTPVVSLSPVSLAAPGRGLDLHLRVSAPVVGTSLPVVVFAHGFGSSADGYLPLAAHWAARGFVVVQPTFLDSRRIALPEDDPRVPVIWRQRVDDVRRILDHLNVVEAAVPGLAGRVDRSRIAAVGHSFGAHTVGLLLGARVIDAEGANEDMRDDRIRAGVLLCAGGRGGADLSPFGAQHFPYLNQTYGGMSTPRLIVAGDKDVSPLTVRGPDWFTDAYTSSPGEKWLATVFGGEHMLGGISGYRVSETTDESPERVDVVRRITQAYLRGALYEDGEWAAAARDFASGVHALARIEGKGTNAPG